MMKRKLAVVLAVLPALSSLACDDPLDWPTGRTIGSGRVATETRPLAPFSALEVDGPLRVRILPTVSTSIEVTAEDNVLALVRSEVTDDRLRLSLVSGPLTTNHGIVVLVPAPPRLRAIEADGAARIEAEAVDLDTLDTQLSGASSAELSGRADRHELRLAGASHCRASGLLSRRVSATLSGASSARVSASESLVVEASGVSSLEYLGEPVLTTQLSGNSSVRRVGP
jgi:hypothetical protein